MAQRTAKTPTDPRWQALRLVQDAMEPLGLRDRDLAVLRGLLSFLPAHGWDGPLLVFASNRSLQDRCGGMDERTLRRRLARLCDLGLARRQASPNGKRFVLRDAGGATVLGYGLDLAPLRAALPRLQAMAEAAREEAQQLRCLRALLRERMFRLGTLILPETLADLGRLLRRKSANAALQAALAALPRPEETAAIAPDLTASDGQIDRHIQSSKQDSEEKNHATPAEAITLQECQENAPGALEFAPVPPRNWQEVEDLAQVLAPALGIDAAQMQRSRSVLGLRGATLAILGLVQAQGRIRDPRRYLSRLTQRAAEGGLNLARMFRSLTQSLRFPPGNLGALAG